MSPSFTSPSSRAHVPVQDTLAHSSQDVVGDDIPIICPPVDLGSFVRVESPQIPQHGFRFGAWFRFILPFEVIDCTDAVEENHGKCDTYINWCENKQ
ncbi:hypothetical protein BaRGS_00000317 [Batillaria attramentaria]|uniref:Uncharacterized protein n=1 Tax=Batillaria attramentaria TaxID=370345 RepID=A0ABD0MCG5_9CAEN